MANVKFQNVTIKFPIYTASSRSVKRSIARSIKKLDFNSLDSTIKHVTAINNLTFNLSDGDRLGIMGQNGSGKSTLLRTIAGVYLPTSGSVFIKGTISSLIDISLGIDLEATGVENIRLRGVMMGMSLKKINSEIDEIIEFTELGRFINYPVKTYSTGMLMRLGFAVSTAFQADILLMDEWLTVGDENFQKKATKRLNNFISKSSIFVLASHSNELINDVTNKKLYLNSESF